MGGAAHEIRSTHADAHAVFARRLGGGQGHRKLGELAFAQLDLDAVLFVPAALPPHKDTPPGSPDARARLALVEEALKGVPLPFRVDSLEIDRGGTSYTVDTLEVLCEREPGSSWILIMGSDQLPNLSRWHRVDRIFELASAAVAIRPGTPFQLPDVHGIRLSPSWSGSAGELVALPGTDLDLASTDLRERLQATPHEDPGGLPPQVLGTIRSENLYR